MDQLSCDSTRCRAQSILSSLFTPLRGLSQFSTTLSRSSAYPPMDFSAQKVVSICVYFISLNPQCIIVKYSLINLFIFYNSSQIFHITQCEHILSMKIGMCTGCPKSYRQMMMMMICWDTKILLGQKKQSYYFESGQNQKMF